MRRLALAALVVLTFAPAARADCGASASTSTGGAPLRVTFTATCPSATYHWEFGDGRVSDGATVEHVYAAGRFAPTLTTDAGAQRLSAVSAFQLQLLSPHRARYARVVTFAGKVFPAVDGPVRIGKVTGRIRGGVFRVHIRLTRPGPYVARYAGIPSNRVWVLVRPKLDVRLVGSPTVGSRLRVVARLHPAHAGRLTIRIDGRATVNVDTRRARAARIVVSTQPNRGWAGPGKILHTVIELPSLRSGARGPSVGALERRLRELHYALRGVDGIYGEDDVEAVLAFQKLNGLDRTGAVTPDLWRRLATATVPRARYGGDHVEVDKARQVLFVVRGGKVTLAVHVSTGATGNTPLGLWHVYSKVPGWSWVLWYPSYFLRGFAVHGYPDVPAYPASHGCVRVPMWLAPTVYSLMPEGSSVYVYA